MIHHQKISPQSIVQVNWGGMGGLYYIPVEAQRELFNEIGRNNYIKLPKPGTNPRGVEIAREALMALLDHAFVKFIEINWQKIEIDHNPYKRWIDYWRED